MISHFTELPTLTVFFSYCKAEFFSLNSLQLSPFGASYQLRQLSLQRNAKYEKINKRVFKKKMNMGGVN